MIPITPDLLEAATGCTPALAKLYAPILHSACQLYEINTKTRLAAFLAQVGHESGGFRYVRELADGTAYENRKGLGNNQPGDGPRYRGRGLIQITGRANYRETAASMAYLSAPDFEQDPEALEQPHWAAYSACDWWVRHGCNQLADAGNFDGLTRRINGGINGLEDRIARWRRATDALANAPTTAPPLVQLGPEPEPTVGVTTEHDLQNPPPPEKPMAPFIAAALPFVLEAVPSLIDAFKGDSKSAARNSEAAKTVVGIAKQALNAANEQELVEKLQTDPTAAGVVKQAVEAQWFELQKVLGAVNEMEQKNIAAARAYNSDEPMFIDLPWLKMRFVHILSLIFVGISGYFVLRYWPDLTSELRGAVITLMMIAGYNGVRDYWMGSSSGSERKTGMLTERK